MTISYASSLRRFPYAFGTIGNCVYRPKLPIRGQFHYRSLPPFVKVICYSGQPASVNLHPCLTTLHSDWPRATQGNGYQFGGLAHSPVPPRATLLQQFPAYLCSSHSVLSLPWVGGSGLRRPSYRYTLLDRQPCFAGWGFLAFAETTKLPKV